MIYLESVYGTIKVSVTKFPAGELQISLLGLPIDICTVRLHFESSDDIIALHLLTDLLKSQKINISDIPLIVPYFPAARQDRQESIESFGLRVYVDLIKNLGYKYVSVVDPHSTVLAGMFPAGKLLVHDQKYALQHFVSPYLLNGGCAIVAPDLGATKKTEKLKELNPETYLLQFVKTRNYHTGRIDGVYCPDLDNLERHEFSTILVVDDICDGGATFEAIGSTLRHKFPSATLVLIVTHGLFTKSKTELEKYYNRIHYYFNPKDPL
jgi:ribose-phosphate pyrophosphokinase